MHPFLCNKCVLLDKGLFYYSFILSSFYDITFPMSITTIQSVMNWGYAIGQGTKKTIDKCFLSYLECLISMPVLDFKCILDVKCTNVVYLHRVFLCHTMRYLYIYIYIYANKNIFRRFIFSGLIVAE